MPTRDEIYRRETGPTVKVTRVHTNPDPADNIVVFTRETGESVSMFVDQFLSRYTLIAS